MLIAVSGMVGTGKSTLTRLLAARLGLPAVLERIGAAHPWLDQYYASAEGRRRYALHSQLHFMSTAFEDLAERRVRPGSPTGSGPGGGSAVDTVWRDAIVDGTVDEDAEVFAATLADDGTMTPDEHGLYRRLYTQLLDTPGGAPPDAVVYLDAPLDVVLGRIAYRGRPSEQDVEIGYWRRLHGRYATWSAQYTRSPMVRLAAGAVDYATEPEALERVVRQLAAVCPAVAERARGDASAWQPALDATRAELFGPRALTPAVG